MSSMENFQVGQVVKARAGRDKGRFFVVVELVDEQYVLIANGTSRKLDAPKRKKIKHLEPQKAYFANIGEKLLTGVRVFDSELRKSLQSLEVQGASAPGEEG